MNIKKLFAIHAVLAVSCLIAPSAFAQKAGDNVLSVGGVYVLQNSSLGSLNSTGSNAMEAATFNAVNNTLGVTTAQAENVSTMTTSILHMFTDNIAGDLILGIPPKVGLNLQVPGAGPAYKGALPTNYPDGASALAWTPALVVKYIFNEPGAKFRPFVGAGVNYTWFTHVKVESTPLLTTLAGGGAKLTSTWNPVITAGAIYSLNDRWSLNAAVTYMPIKSTASFVSGSGLTNTSGTLTFDPTFFNLAVGYKF